MILQGLTDLDTSKVWEITPNSDVVYEALVIILCGIIYYLHKENLALKAENKEIVNDVHEVSKETVKNLSEIYTKNEVSFQKITNLLDRIIDKLNKY